MIKISNQIVPTKIEDRFIEILDSPNFPWFYLDNVMHKNIASTVVNKNITKSYALVHTLLDKGIVSSDYFDLFNSILTRFCVINKIKLDRVLRVRIRRTFYVKGHTNQKYNIPHVDIIDELPYKTLIYYVDDSDGDTVFFKNKLKKENFLDANAVIDKKVTPKKGTVVYFNGDKYHSGNCPIDFTKRTVINFDFKI